MRHRLHAIHGVFSTDDIIPGRYKHRFVDPQVLGQHVFEDRLPGFARTLAPGSILWSDSVFGIGSSREQAATSLVAAGVEAVIAPAFGRIFYRNAWNVGLRVVALPPPEGVALEGEPAELDVEGGQLSTNFGTFAFPTPPPRLQAILAAGGLMNWLKQKHPPLAVE